MQKLVKKQDILCNIFDEKYKCMIKTNMHIFLHRFLTLQSFDKSLYCIRMSTSWLSSCEDGELVSYVNQNLLLNIRPLLHLIPLFIPVGEVELVAEKNK